MHPSVDGKEKFLSFLWLRNSWCFSFILNVKDYQRLRKASLAFEIVKRYDLKFEIGVNGKRHWRNWESAFSPIVANDKIPFWGRESCVGKWRNYRLQAIFWCSWLNINATYWRINSDNKNALGYRKNDLNKSPISK